MLGFIVRRLVTSLFVLFLASMLVFGAVSSLGDPLASLRANPRTPPSVIEAKKRELNLDKSVPQRYVHLAEGLRLAATWARTTAAARSRPGSPGRCSSPSGWRSARPSSPRSWRWWSACTARCGSTRSATTCSPSSASCSCPRRCSGWRGCLKLYGAIEVNDFFGRRLVYTQGDSSPNFDGGFWARMGDYAGHTHPAGHRPGPDQLRGVEPLPAGDDARRAQLATTCGWPGPRASRTAGCSCATRSATR